MRKNLIATLALVACIGCFPFADLQACWTNYPPTAEIAGGNRWVAPGAEGASLTFDGSGSHDNPSGPISSYIWCFTNNTSGHTDTFVSDESNTFEAVEYTFTAPPGTTYSVTLKVRDSASTLSSNAALVTVALRAPITWYVNEDGVDDIATNGQSWAMPFATLQMALDSASSGDEIHVAAGTYIPRIPTEGDSRLASFHGGEGVFIYGGFAGQGANPDARNISENQTTLSGDLADDDEGEWDHSSHSENCYRVISCYKPKRMDGFTIAGGNANTTGHNSAGGYDGQTTIANCRFEKNYAIHGGALCPSNSTIIGCQFIDNTATYGGAIYSGASPELIGCTFEGNLATTGDGGAIWKSGGLLTATNCVFRENTSALRGGAIYGTGSTLVLKNCIVDRNTGNRGGGITARDVSTTVLTNCTFSLNHATELTYNEGAGLRSVPDTGSSAAVTNCIFWGNFSGTSNGQSYQLCGDNLDVTNSCIQNLDSPFVAVELNNISSDPCFVDAATGDLHLKLTSLCRNTGDSAVIPTCATDYEGQPRMLDGQVDIGADEVYSTLYVDKAAVGSENGASWQDAFRDLEPALTFARAHPGVISEIQVAEGTYFPAYRTDPEDQRSATFLLADGVTVVGGYPSGGGNRNLAGCETILSGAYKDSSGAEVRRYHVVAANAPCNNAKLDGLTIYDGAARGATDGNKRGGGLLCNGSTLTLQNCNISENAALGDGAGVHADAGAVVNLINCLMWGNCADGNGGAICADNSASVNLRNCTVVDNKAILKGGGVFRATGAGNVSISNSIVWGNIGCGNGNVLDAQICVWWAVTVQYSCVGKDGYTGDPFDGIGNTALSPRFIESGQWQCKRSGDETALSTTIRDFLGRYAQGHDTNLLIWYRRAT